MITRRKKKLTTIFKIAYPNIYSDFKIRKRTFSHFYQILVVFKLCFQNACFKTHYLKQPIQMDPRCSMLGDYKFLKKLYII